MEINENRCEMAGYEQGPSMNLEYVLAWQIAVLDALMAISIFRLGHFKGRCRGLGTIAWELSIIL